MVRRTLPRWLLGLSVGLGELDLDRRRPFGAKMTGCAWVGCVLDLVTISSFADGVVVSSEELDWVDVGEAVVSLGGFSVAHGVGTLDATDLECVLVRRSGVSVTWVVDVAEEERKLRR